MTCYGGRMLDTDAVAEFHVWAQETFGSGLRTTGCVNHIRSELEEITDAPTDIEEWCDVIILALNGATRAATYQLPDTATSHEIAELALSTLREKMTRNYRRTWARAEDGLMRHVTEG